MSITTQQIATTRGSFEVRLQGAMYAPLVIALHGFPDVASTFDDVGSELVNAGFRVAAPQVRGYAPSTLEVPKSRTLFDAIAQDTLALADVLAPGEPFCILGHDNGAFAVYSLLRIAGPRVAAAVTLTAAHPAAVFKNSGKLPSQMWRSRYAMLFQVPGFSDWWASRSGFAYLEVLWRRWAHDGWILPKSHLSEMKACMAASWPAPLLHYRAMPFSGDETPLSQPTLYLIGDQDGCVLPEAGRGQEKLFVGPFRSEVVPGAGHFLHLEKPAVLTPKIINWFTTYAIPRLHHDV